MVRQPPGSTRTATLFPYTALFRSPPYHIAGIAALLSSIYAMRRIVLLPAFEPDAWLQLAASERASNAFVVPTMLARIITQMDAGSAPDLGALQDRKSTRLNSSH